MGSINVLGHITADLKGDFYEVRLEDNPDHTVIAKTCGQMRKHRISVQPGDNVRVELSPYDLTRGRIVWRDA